MQYEIISGMLAVAGREVLGMIHDMTFTIGGYGCPMVYIDFTDAAGSRCLIRLSPVQISVA